MKRQMKLHKNKVNYINDNNPEYKDFINNCL